VLGPTILVRARILPLKSKRAKIEPEKRVVPAIIRGTASRLECIGCCEIASRATDRSKEVHDNRTRADRKSRREVSEVSKQRREKVSFFASEHESWNTSYLRS